MNKRNKKLIDGILKRSQISDASPPRVMARTSPPRPAASAHNLNSANISYDFSKRRPETQRISFGKFGRFLLTSKISLILVLILSVVPMAAFEAHVVNVTATIEQRPCQEFASQSKGFWVTHSLLWIFPQTLGSDTIATSTDAIAVFNANNSIMRNKLKKQLLALEFNVAFYGSGSALVPQSTTTVADLITQANALLTQNPPPPQTVLENMKNEVESVNEAGTVSTCPSGTTGLLDPSISTPTDTSSAINTSILLPNIGTSTKSDASLSDTATSTSTTTSSDTVGTTTSTESNDSQGTATSSTESFEGNTGTSTDQTSQNNENNTTTSTAPTTETSEQTTTPPPQESTPSDSGVNTSSESSPGSGGTSETPSPAS